MNKQIAIKDLLPNPFRNMEHYKIRDEKVKSLIQSFETTGIWSVIIGRQAHDGKVELAFGHHRKAAAEKLYGQDHKLEIIVMDLSDEEMLKYMANENQHDFATSFLTEMETVEAVVKALAAGRIKLEPRTPPARRSDERYAPSFVQASDDDDAHNDSIAYTPLTLAKFLGWTYSSGGKVRAVPKVFLALQALELVEQKHLKIQHLEDLGYYACHRILDQVRAERDERIKELAAAKEYADRIDADFQKVKGTSKENELSYRHEQSKRDLEKAESDLATEPAAVAERVVAYERNKKRKDKEAKDVARAGLPKKKELPSINNAAETLRRNIENVLTSRDQLGKRLKEISEFKHEIDPQTLRFLALALGRLCKRSERCVIALGFKRERIKSAASKSLAA
jgi:ParB-like chromosome segregation protein Spo0J